MTVYVTIHRSLIAADEFDRVQPFESLEGIEFDWEVDRSGALHIYQISGSLKKTLIETFAPRTWERVILE